MLFNTIGFLFLPLLKLPISRTAAKAYLTYIIQDDEKL